MVDVENTCLNHLKADKLSVPSDAIRGGIGKDGLQPEGSCEVKGFAVSIGNCNGPLVEDSYISENPRATVGHLVDLAEGSAKTAKLHECVRSPYWQPVDDEC